MDYTCAMKCITATSKTAEETTKIPEDTMPNMDIGMFQVL